VVEDKFPASILEEDDKEENEIENDVVLLLGVEISKGEESEEVLQGLNEESMKDDDRISGDEVDELERETTGDDLTELVTLGELMEGRWAGMVTTYRPLEVDEAVIGATGVEQVSVMVTRSTKPIYSVDVMGCHRYVISLFDFKNVIFSLTNCNFSAIKENATRST
jgi:hypothetical protein